MKTLTLARRASRPRNCKKPLEMCMKREKKARKAQETEQKRRKLAEMVNNSAISIKKAAESCGLTHRQMAQYVAAAQKEQPCSEAKAGNSPEKK